MVIKYLIAYLATGISFAIIDSIWLRNMYVKLYSQKLVRS